MGVIPATEKPRFFMKGHSMTTDYTPFLQNGLRAIVRDILIDAAQNGLQDDSHFFITFKTDFPGVDIPAFVKSKYPVEMSIVLQHQFDNLVVRERDFSVDLAFGGVYYTLTVPFNALMQFADPSVQFGLALIPQQTESKESGIPADVIDLSALRKKK